MKSAVAVFCVVSAVALAAIGFGILWRTMTGVGLYDTNLAAFHDTLSQSQGEAIIRTSRDHITLMVVLLAVTNLMWMGLGVYLLRCVSRATKRSSTGNA